MNALALLLLSIVPREDVAIRETVDLAERNFFYDDQGRLVFEQLILSDWSDKHERFDVRAWRLIKVPTQVPVRDWDVGGYRLLWMDGERLRDVRIRSYVETWTMHDPELAAREILEKELRRGLREPTFTVQSRRRR